MQYNPILIGDSYKYSHAAQAPKGFSASHSYLESRGGELPYVLFFGLQYYLKQYLTQRITREDVEEAEEFMRLHGEPFNKEGWLYIVEKLQGKWPVVIRAVPEGSIVPNHNVLMTVESTDENVPWVASFLETMLLKVWYTCTVASQSYFLKQLIGRYLKKSSDNPEEILFKLHDFGYRGVSSEESALLGGMAHLVNFRGTDTVAGIIGASRYYNEKMAGFSIVASEHSTMTMWGKGNEVAAYANMLEVYKDQPIFACVSDSYDIYNAVENIWGGTLKDMVIARANEGKTLVIRPDSGEPEAVCIRLMTILERCFGATKNTKGFKVINHNVRLIQGDGVNHSSIRQILEGLIMYGYSASNISFGMGGALLQSLNRDTLKFAFKCSAAKINDKWIEVYKDPITDLGKKSKRGRLDLELTSHRDIRTVRFGMAEKSLLTEVYRDGEMLREYSFEQIRANTETPYRKSLEWQDKSV